MLLQVFFHSLNNTLNYSELISKSNDKKPIIAVAVSSFAFYEIFRTYAVELLTHFVFRSQELPWHVSAAQLFNYG